MVSISNELNRSRTTLYNHGALLKRYIKLSEQYYNVSNPYEQVEVLKADITRLDNQVNLMMGRDIDTELLSVEIDTH